MLLEKRKFGMFSIVINGGSYPSASSCAIRRCKRPVYIFLYAPNTSIVNYIDSLVDFCKIEFKRSYREFNHNVSDYYEYVVYKTK